MKRKNIAICIDIGIIVLVFFIVFTIPVLFGSLSKKDEENKKKKDVDSVSQDIITNDTIKDNQNKRKLVDAGIDVTMVKVYITNTGKIKSMPLEEYVLGVVLSEMPAAFDEEALMAQSILARTYVISKKLKSCSKSEEADICDSTHCQVYTDPEEKKKQWGSKADEYYEKIKSAVEKTANLIVSYEGVIIEYPQYFAISSGKTEEAESVFSIDIPYLQSVESPGEEEAPDRKSVV